MEGKTAFLYAGQGSQATGMGKDFYDAYPKFREVFDSCLLDFDLKEICFENPDNRLMQTEYTQPCMVAFACGVTEIFKDQKIRPDYVCGLSLGEYSALYAAGVWPLADTMKIISARGKAMAEASEGINASMAAVMGLSLDEIRECCRKAGIAGIVSVCNINCPGQIVIGGDKAAVELASSFAKEDGARRIVPLTVSGPFHTEYMKPAGVKLQKVLQGCSFHSPAYEVVYNVLGRPKTREEDIKDLLVKQIQQTVHMQESIEYLIHNGVTKFIEIGPGTALSGFVKKTLKAMGTEDEGISIFSINKTEDLNEIV